MAWAWGLRACALLLAVLPRSGTSITWGSRGDPVSKEQVIVESRQGKVLGWNDGDVSSFLGIPFAEPPIRKLRFRPPLPKKSWYPNTYSALKFSPECLQSDLYIASDDIQRDEDCLYLNVWRPSRARGLSPVMIWIYGGAFIHGGSSKPEYNGHQLATKGVVVVTFNYRLGALGFLVSTVDGLYGNYGLADQKAVLQWVQDNIASFGGDPDRVTLFGESAGAMSIGLHLLDQELRAQDRREQSPPAAPAPPLFHRVILQSNPLGYKYRPISVANFIGAAFKEQVDCDDLLCLQREAADELIHVQDSLMAVPRSIGDFFTWGPVLTDASFFRELRLRPVIRTDLANVTVFQPMVALQALQMLSLPVVLGSNAHEGTLFVFTAYPARMTRLVFSAVVLSMFRSAALSVMRVYDSLIKVVDAQRSPDYRLVLAQILGDYLFACPTQKVALALARLRRARRMLTATFSQPVSVGEPRNASRPVALLGRDRRSALTVLNEARREAAGSVFLYDFRLATRTPGFPFCAGLSCHTSELPYVFDRTDIVATSYVYPAPMKINELRRDELMGLHVRQHVEVARLMSEHWTTFARFGDVNGLLADDGDYEYVPGLGVRSAALWPAVLGQPLPADRQVCALSRSGGAGSLGTDDRDPEDISRPYDPSHSYAELPIVLGEDDAAADEEHLGEALRINRLVHAYSQAYPNDGETPSRSVRRVVFAEQSRVVEEDRDRDCLCLFWDQLGYRF